MRRMPPFLLAALLLAGCRQPDASARFLPASREFPRATEILRTSYGLQAPPPFVLDVAKPSRDARGAFTLTIQEPGWRVLSPLECLETRVEEEGASTRITWELAPERVSAWSMGGTPPLLLVLARGADRRVVQIPTQATRGTPRERRENAAAAVILVPGMAIMAPFWVPAALARSSLDPSRKVALPGPKARPTCPSNQGLGEVALERGAGGRTLLRLDAQSGPPPLAELRRSIAWFHPGLAEGLVQDPDQPYRFRLPLAPDATGPWTLLLLLPGYPGGKPGWELWAIYAPAGNAWVKAWCLATGPGFPWAPAVSG